MAFRNEEDEMLRRLTPQQRIAALESKRRVAIVDPITGEDKTELYEAPVYKTSQKQKTSYQSIYTLSEHEKLNGGYVYAFFTSLKPMSKQFPTLNQSDLARIMFLSTYITWNTGELRYDNGRVIDKKGLERLIGISQNKFSEFYKKIVAAGVIHESDDGLLIVDKSAFYRGEAKDLLHKLEKETTYTKLFRKTVRKLYDAYKGRQIKILGIIYALLPYINFHYNIIASNPLERDPRLVRPLELQDIARALGYHNPQKLRLSMKRIVHDGQPVFAFVDMQGKGQRAIVNPRVLFAGSSKEALDAVSTLFNEKGTI